MGCICSKGVSDINNHHVLKQKDKSRQRLMTHEQVLKHIYTNWKTLQHDSSVVEALKQIKFVKSADPESVELYKPNELFDPCDAFLKSVFSGEVHKFPAQSFAKSDKWLNILRKTGLRNSDDASVLIECAQRVELRTKSSALTLEEATIEVLKYLDRIWDTLSSLDISKLQKIPFIGVGNKIYLVRACLIFTHITIDLRPVAFELPSCYLPFLKILKELGLKDEMLSVSSALSILSRLKKYCGNQRLCPNELRAVIKVLEFICDEIEHQPNLDRFEWESSLVVPDDSCRLVDPHSCVYIDPRGSLYLEYIDSSKLRFVHHYVSERLCLAFGVKKLSEVVVAEEVTCPPDSETCLADHIIKISRDKKGRVGCGIGFLGRQVTSEDSKKIMFNPRGPYYKGEIVALRSKKTKRFKYGRIPQDTTSPTAGHRPYRLDVETSPGNIETIVSSQVHFFIASQTKYRIPMNGHNEAPSI